VRGLEPQRQFAPIITAVTEPVNADARICHNHSENCWRRRRCAEDLYWTTLNALPTLHFQRLSQQGRAAFETRLNGEAWGVEVKRLIEELSEAVKEHQKSDSRVFGYLKILYFTMQ
jgi:hypothetical protein